LREHLLKVQEITKRVPIELQNLVELPEVFKYCWQDFINLNNTRQGGFGPQPISYLEMQAYFNLNSVVPEPWEIRIIKVLDKIALEAINARTEKANKNNK
jgi:hypothetical protein